MLTRAELKNELTEAGIRPSVQRLAIYEYVKNSRMHPTAESVYEALREDLGSLSLTTVYSTLKLFVDAGLVLMLHVDENFLRYDGDTSVHAHFKCNKCGAVIDLPVSGDYNSWLGGAGALEITDAQLYLKGVCGDCRN